MEQSTTEVTQAQTSQPAPTAEGTTQEGQTTDQSAAQEVTQQQKPEGEAEHRSRAYRRLDRWRTRAIEAETQLKVLRETQGKPAERQQPPESGSDAPKREQFETYEEFIRAEARHYAKIEAREEAKREREESRKSDEQTRAKSEQDRVQRDWNAKCDKARDAVEDFDEVCAESEAVVTQAMSSAILESDHGALIAYHLAKNPAEAERISKLPPSKQAAAIVALEEKVTKPAKRPSSAPEPINPVGQKGKEVEKDPSQMTDKEFADWRKRQIAQRGRH